MRLTQAARATFAELVPPSFKASFGSAHRAGGLKLPRRCCERLNPAAVNVNCSGLTTGAPEIGGVGAC
jgi:hypothetical protein